MINELLTFAILFAAGGLPLPAEVALKRIICLMAAATGRLRLAAVVEIEMVVVA